MKMNIGLVGDIRVQAFNYCTASKDVNLLLYSRDNGSVLKLLEYVKNTLRIECHQLDVIITFSFLHDLIQSKRSGKSTKNTFCLKDHIDYNDIINAVIAYENELRFWNRKAKVIWCIPYPVDFSHNVSDGFDFDGSIARKFFAAVHHLKYILKQCIPNIHLIDLGKIFFKDAPSCEQSFCSIGKLSWPTDMTIDGIFPSETFVDCLLPKLIIEAGRVFHEKNISLPKPCQWVDAHGNLLSEELKACDDDNLASDSTVLPSIQKTDDGPTSHQTYSENPIASGSLSLDDMFKNLGKLKDLPAFMEMINGPIREKSISTDEQQLYDPFEEEDGEPCAYSSQSKGISDNQAYERNDQSLDDACGYRNVLPSGRIIPPEDYLKLSARFSEVSTTHDNLTKDYYQTSFPATISFTDDLVNMPSSDADTVLRSSRKREIFPSVNLVDDRNLNVTNRQNYMEVNSLANMYAPRYTVDETNMNVSHMNTVESSLPNNIHSLPNTNSQVNFNTKNVVGKQNISYNRKVRSKSPFCDDTLKTYGYYKRSPTPPKNETNVDVSESQDVSAYWDMDCLFGYNSMQSMTPSYRSRGNSRMPINQFYRSRGNFRGSSRMPINQFYRSRGNFRFNSRVPIHQFYRSRGNSRMPINQFYRSRGNSRMPINQFYRSRGNFRGNIRLPLIQGYRSRSNSTDNSRSPIAQSYRSRSNSRDNSRPPITQSYRSRSNSSDNSRSPITQSYRSRSNSRNNSRRSITQTYRSRSNSRDNSRLSTTQKYRSRTNSGNRRRHSRRSRSRSRLSRIQNRRSVNNNSRSRLSSNESNRCGSNSSSKTRISRRKSISGKKKRCSKSKSENQNHSSSKSRHRNRSRNNSNNNDHSLKREHIWPNLSRSCSTERNFDSNIRGSSIEKSIDEGQSFENEPVEIIGEINISDRIMSPFDDNGITIEKPNDIDDGKCANYNATESSSTSETDPILGNILSDKAPACSDNRTPTLPTRPSKTGEKVMRIKINLGTNKALPYKKSTREDSNCSSSRNFEFGSLPSSSKSHQQFSEEYSIETTLSLLDSVADSLGVLGSALKCIAKDAIDKLPCEEKVLEMFVDKDTRILMDMCVDKMAMKASIDGSEYYQKAQTFIRLLLEEAETAQVRNKCRPETTFVDNLDIAAIAELTLGKNTEETIDFIKNMLIYNDVTVSKVAVNDVFRAVTAEHLLLLSS